MWKPWKRGSFREQKTMRRCQKERLPSGKTYVRTGTEGRQHPSHSRQFWNLLLRTALRRELLSPGRQSALSMAMDQKKSSFFSCLHMTEMIFLLYRLFKTPALGEGWSMVKNQCKNFCGRVTFLLPSLPKWVTTLLLTGIPPQHRWQTLICFKASPVSSLKQSPSIL